MGAGARHQVRGVEESSACEEEGGDDQGRSHRRRPGAPLQTLAGTSGGGVASRGAEWSRKRERGADRRKEIEAVSLIDGMMGNFMEVLPPIARKSMGGVVVGIVPRKSNFWRKSSA